MGALGAVMSTHGTAAAAHIVRLRRRARLPVPPIWRAPFTSRQLCYPWPPVAAAPAARGAATTLANTAGKRHRVPAPHRASTAPPGRPNGTHPDNNRLRGLPRSAARELRPREPESTWRNGRQLEALSTTQSRTVVERRPGSQSQLRKSQYAKHRPPSRTQMRTVGVRVLPPPDVLTGGDRTAVRGGHRQAYVSGRRRAVSGGVCVVGIQGRETRMAAEMAATSGRPQLDGTLGGNEERGPQPTAQEAACDYI